MPHTNGPLNYPPTDTVDHTDDYHGTPVADPYRWLEDLDATETAEWVKRQNDVTMPFLAAIPERDAIRKRLTQLWDYERVGAPFQRNGRWFVSHNDGLQNQYTLQTMDSLDGERRVLLDPNTWSEDGTVALTSASVDDEAQRIAVGISRAGSDWTEFKVVDVDTGNEHAEVLRWAKWSVASWLPDGRGFFYSRYDEPTGDAMEDANYFHKLYLHRLGTEQSEDELVYERTDDKEMGFGGAVTDDGRYLAIRVWKGTDPKSAFFYRELGGSDVVELLRDFDAEYRFLGNDGTRFFFLTDLDAPRRRVVAIDVVSREWTTVIAQQDETLEWAQLVGGRLFAHYLVDACSAVRVHTLEGALEREVDLPGLGTVAGFAGRSDDTETFYVFTSFVDPGAIFRYDIASGESTLWHRPDVAFDPNDFETTRAFVTSADGTRVPVFVTASKALDRTSPTAAWLYGYGGFQISMTPAFSPAIVSWAEMGGIFVQACLRGGGEYGEEWHLAGTKERKQNVFDDCVAVAEWLIAERYTTKDRLILAGGSNGGLLVGACMSQRPDLFAVCLPSRGVLDMLRYQRFTIGWAWVSDYGSSDVQAEFASLFAYSPLHNLRAGTSYPATLVTTADHDDRVVPSHSFKFTSALQAAQGGDAPVLIRIETDAGHGVGTPTAKIIEESADVRAFAAHLVGLGVPSSWG